MDQEELKPEIQQLENLDGHSSESGSSSPERSGIKKLEGWLNQNLKIEMSDGRVLIGIFLCTDRDANVILGSCHEYLKAQDCLTEDPRVLGLVMVPGRHIVSIHYDAF